MEGSVIEGVGARGFFKVYGIENTQRCVDESECMKRCGVIRAMGSYCLGFVYREL